MHKASGDTAWVESPEAEAEARSAGDAELKSVSVTPDGSSGYIVGVTSGTGTAAGSTIMRLSDGHWQRETISPDLIADGRPELISVSVVNSDEAWAITGAATRDLRVYHRTSGLWVRVTTDPDPRYPIFAGPHPSQAKNGAFNQGAYGGAVKADTSGAWIGGQIFPSDVLHPTGDALRGDASRPFAIHVSDSGTQVTSYCPDQYSLDQTSAGLQDSRAMCDQPFPFSILDLTSFSLLPNGEVFAGGVGLFHFVNGGWFHEPDSNGYLISISMSSSKEGWVATTGNAFGAGGSVVSSENTLGHWSATPATPRVARWPQPQTLPLHGVAAAPDGSGRALAVGEEGAVVGYAPDVGWDQQTRVVLGVLHSVAWSGPNTAWAVGTRGTITQFDGTKWSESPESQKLTNEALFAVAFVSPSEGYAVGSNGIILRFDGTHWSTDAGSSSVTKRTLFSVAARPGTIIAVGAQGTVIERSSGSWHHSSAESLAARSTGEPSNLQSVAVLPDGTAIIGGNQSTLLVKQPGSSFQPLPQPVEGDILAVNGSRQGGALRLFVSVDPETGPSATKYKGEKLFATRSTLVTFEGGTWRDATLMRRLTTYAGSTDGSNFLDPIFAITLDASGTGWGVGGLTASQPDDTHIGRLQATSSIYRVTLGSDPRPAFSQASVQLPKTGVNFAFFGETWCSQGLCSMSMGSGTQADEVALQIKKEIESASHLANGPKFVMFGGNARAIGMPEELGESKGFLSSFKGLPVYGAVGNRDLFNGISETILGQIMSGASIILPKTSGDPGNWKEVFAHQSAPWGDGPLPANIQEPSLKTGTGTLPTAGLARTHYAFDYMQNARPSFRVIVVDSSNRSFGTSTTQNPPEKQDTWFGNVMLDASNAGLPTIIVMNQPTILPDREALQSSNWTQPDQGSFESLVEANRVSAVLTAGARWNVRGGYPANLPVVPYFIMGGGGAPLGYDRPSDATQDPTKLPSDGFYNAWFLVNIDPTAPSVLGLPGQAKVTVTPFPILESVAIHGMDGRSVAGGNTMRFTALARSLEDGTTDPEQAKSTYYSFGYGNSSVCDGAGQGHGVCSARDAMRPPYRFFSEDPAIIDFVKPNYSFGANYPLRDSLNKIVKDPIGEFGLACAFKVGSTFIDVESGFQRSRMKVTVGPGFGPCVDQPVVAPYVPVVTNPVGAPQILPKPPLSHPHFVFEQPYGVILPPVPAPVVAPAPPASAAGSKREEKEAQLEHEGQDGDAEFTAIRHNRRHGIDPAMELLLITATAMVLGLLASGVVMSSRKPKMSHSYAYLIE
ncbi:MAG: hypothetical protein LC723_12365 [Actinobacteria bacterium]|nr:hypothetical protein [Actinomycetota bacterium]